MIEQGKVPARWREECRKLGPPPWPDAPIVRCAKELLMAEYRVAELEETLSQQAATITRLRSALEKIVEVLTGDGLSVSYESSAGLIIAKAALVNAEDKP